MLQEAEPLLLEGFSGMKDREAKVPPAAKPRLAEAIRRLVDLYTAWEKPEKAAEWERKLDEENLPSTPGAKVENVESKCFLILAVCQWRCERSLRGEGFGAAARLGPPRN